MYCKDSPASSRNKPLVIGFSESSDFFEDVVNRANDNPSVSKCYTTTGSGSHILHVNTEDSTSLEKLLRIIQSWPGVKRTETQLILNSYKKTNLLTFRAKEKNND